MAYGEDSIQLPDGEELVMIDRADWLATAPGPDPRETSLDLRRQAGATARAYSPPSAPPPPSKTSAT
jgi:hypothetical protein